MKDNMKTKEFEAEVKQLLDIVINSLYTDREIFLRELISNASDALEKLRYLKITGEEIQDEDLPLEIRINLDDVAGTLTITDTGVGMTEEELVENLGTIAHSGSKAFIEHLSKTQSDKDLDLIGQFGVGFYSAFMVAKKIEVYSRSYQKREKGAVWSSEGAGGYTVSQAGNLKRGTKIILHLKDSAREFAKSEKIKRIIKQYSNFVPFPIFVNGERVNTLKALWTKNKNEIKDEEYSEFYKYIANTQEEPLYKLHFSADAPLSINAILFVPRENIERFGFGRMDPGVNLYSKKVLIQERSEEILPEWMRFVRGVVDSEELPLNISRESMQDSALVSKLQRVISGRFIKFLKEQAEKDHTRYSEFWEKFGIFIKEGIANDFTHRDDLVKLLRFQSSKSEGGKLLSLDDYVKRAQEGQEAIYYINGPSREAIENGPYLEYFKNKGIEVIYTFEAIDDYILSILGEYEGKKLISVDQADLELPKDDEKEKEQEQLLTEEEIKDLSSWIKKVLGSRVKEVRKSKRLVENPAVVLNPGGITSSMERVAQLLNKEKGEIGPKVLEINTKHPVIKYLNEARKKDEEFAKTAVEQLFDNALIAAGLVVDPRLTVKRMHEILERALK